jgi:sphingolipid 4-desaturase/C4-monooxygenase
MLASVAPFNPHFLPLSMQVLSVIVAQFIMAYLVRDWSWWTLWIAAYVISGTLNQNLFCAQHEISHCLAFRRPFHNKLLALVANFPLVVPVAVKFREYHHDHHLFLGVDGGDVDLPTVFEARLVSNTFMKVIYGFFYIVVYGVRPLLVRPKAAGSGDVINFVCVMTCNAAVLYFWGLKSLVYLFAGSIMGGGLHPLAGHLIAEHYMFEKGQETYSYYGPLNALAYNVGYHNEHHDFPQIPQTRLHKLRELAPEFYEPLYKHTSWCRVIWKFLSDPTVGPWSRMHRLQRDGTTEGNARFISGQCAYGAELAMEMEKKETKDKAATIDSAEEDESGEEAAVSQRLRRRSALRKAAAGVHARNDSAVEQPAATK